MKLFTLLEVAALLKSPLTDNQLLISEFCIDSREVKEASLFFALKGERVDGHTYLADVASKGAIAAVVSTQYKGPDYGLKLFYVNDVLLSMQNLAKALLSKYPAKIIAVTGSVGKTTTKDFLAILLKSLYRVAATPGNNNSRIGVPLSLLNYLQDDTEIFVVEMGMTMSGQIAQIVDIAPPFLAIITTVELMHASNFATLTDIAKAKGEIFSHPNTRIGVLSKDIADFTLLSKIGSSHKISFSILNPQADYFLRTENNEILITEYGKTTALGSFTLLGEHNKHNFLGAVVAARCLNVDWECIRAGLKELKLPEMRLQQVEKGGIIFIHDAYNAGTVSMKAALKSLPKSKNGGKRLAVIGEMLELGKFSEECHQEVGEFALQYVDEVFCFGQACAPILEIWKAANRPAYGFDKLDDLLISLRQNVQQGDVVLLKGSRLNALGRVLDQW